MDYRLSERMMVSACAAGILIVMLGNRRQSLSAADVASRCRLEGQGRGAVRGGACVEPRHRHCDACHCGNHDPCVIREKPAASARAAGFFALEEDLADADEDQKAAK